MVRAPAAFSIPCPTSWPVATASGGVTVNIHRVGRMLSSKRSRLCGLHLRLWSNLDFCQAAHQLGSCFFRVRPTRFAQPIKLHNVEVLAPQFGRQLPLCQSGLAAQLRDRLAQALALTRVNGFVHAPIMRAALGCTQNASRLHSCLPGQAHAMNYFGYHGGLALY